MNGGCIRPPRFGAGVLTNMPGVGLWGVVGTAKFMLRGGYVVDGRRRVGLGVSEL